MRYDVKADVTSVTCDLCCTYNIQQVATAVTVVTVNVLRLRCSGDSNITVR